jgi:site-specific DNA-methyltransferase (adenine-specific)
MIYLGDCLDVMGSIPEGSIDLVLCDLPYGVTSLRWDVIIPFEPLWAHYKRLLKPRGAVVLTASQPFTSLLTISNINWFKYCLVWEKEVGTNFLSANYQPLKVHEDIVVFSPAASSYSSRGTMTYNPQMANRRPISGGKKASIVSTYSHRRCDSGKKPRRAILEASSCALARWDRMAHKNPSP